MISILWIVKYETHLNNSYLPIITWVISIVIILANIIYEFETNWKQNNLNNKQYIFKMSGLIFVFA